MTKEQFDKETFGFPKFGESDFRSGRIYGDEFAEIDCRTVRHRVRFGVFDESNILTKLWLQATDLDGFYKLVKSNKEARMERFATLALKNDREFIKNIAKSGKHFYTSSDAGGIKIGNDGFSIIINNGYGNTPENIVAILEEDTFNISAFEFWNHIMGDEINIYKNDCGEDIIATLSGRYSVYVNDRVVIFEMWDQ